MKRVEVYTRSVDLVLENESGTRKPLNLPVSLLLRSPLATDQQPD